VSPGVATKVIGGCCALTAFAASVTAGLFADNPAETILLRALGAMVIGQVVGTIVGAIGERTVAEALKKYKETHPVSDPRMRAHGDAPTASSSGDGVLTV